LHFALYAGNMAVMAREAWTDERLDDLNERLGRLEARVDTGFEEMRREFAAQNRMLIQLFVAMMLGFLGIIATILTQL
jgi:hypothetical protein